jgi:hypothetical protein
MKKLALVGLLMLALLASAGSCLADPSSDFERNGDVYDDWNFCRTRSWGDDGFFQRTESTFRPAIAFESLGELKDKAWEVGESFKSEYSDPNELAEQIFAYARDYVTYTSDAIQFGYDEFARNADEVVEDIQSMGSSRGDCEDYAVLLAVMFKAADLRSAVVLAPEHAAALVHLPDYPDANAYWSLDGESGWIWAEATGRTNPLGWTPSQFMRSDLAVYEIGEENVKAEGESEASAPNGGGGVFFGGSSFFSFILFFWIISSLLRR